MKTANDVLTVAKKEIGTKESPANSNNVKYNTWYYGKQVTGTAYPWCMVFVQWVFNKAGFNLYKTASCSALISQYKKKSPKQWVTYNFKAGDIIFFDFTGKKSTAQHVGIVESTDPVACTVTTIEGNTSMTSNDNGGAVMRRVRSVKFVVGAIRPTYHVSE